MLPPIRQSRILLPALVFLAAWLAGPAWLSADSRPDSSNPRLDPIIRHPKTTGEEADPAKEKKRAGSEEIEGETERILDPPAHPSAARDRDRLDGIRRDPEESAASSRRAAMEPEEDRDRFQEIARSPRGTRSSGGAVVSTSLLDELEGLDDPQVQRALHFVRARPEDPAHWNRLGNALVRIQRISDAKEAYHRALSLDSGSSAVWNNLCGVHLRQYEDEEALEACESAIQADPYNALAYYNAGIALDRMQRIEEAVDHYYRAISLDSSLKDPKVNPNVVNNRHLQVLKLRLYRDKGGSLTLPLQEVR